MSITHSVHNDWLREEGLIEMKMIKAGPITEIPVSSHTRYLAKAAFLLIVMILHSTAPRRL
jgi:hypothetical protein